MDNERLLDQVAAYKGKARRLFEDAVTALIALAFRYQHLGDNFLWDADPVLERECNAILRGFSEKARDAAKKKAEEIIKAEGWNNDALDVFDGEGENSILWSLDMAGSHLRELLEIWIAIAFVEKMTPEYLRVLVIRYVANPYASSQWARLPAGLLKWGRGYQRDLINQVALIGQDAIVGSVREAEWIDALENGASFWVWRRGSNYKCPECEANAGRVFPIDIPFSTMHARCMCYAEYHYGSTEI